jgi:hypothetical protein
VKEGLMITITLSELLKQENRPLIKIVQFRRQPIRIFLSEKLWFVVNTLTIDE